MTEGINEDTPLRDEKGPLVTYMMMWVKYGAELHRHQSACSGRICVSRRAGLGLQGAGSWFPWGGAVGGKGQEETFWSGGSAPCLAQGGCHTATKQ